MKSLFIVSLHRSLSTFVFENCQKSLNLKEPDWTVSGEILNIRRHALNKYLGNDTGNNFLKFVTEHHHYDRFHRSLSFLDDVIKINNYIYKDVVNPFIISSWLSANRMNVLRIKRNMADICFAMISKFWTYPSCAYKISGNIIESIIFGLVLGESALEKIPSITIEFEELIVTENYLFDILSKIYPDVSITKSNYLTPKFIAKRASIIKKRETIEYKMLSNKIDEIKNLARKEEILL